MDSLHLRQVLLHIVQEVKCPVCSHSITPHDVQISNIDDENCQIMIECIDCHKSFGGIAKMNMQITPEGKKLNASTLIHKGPKVQEDVVPQDKEFLHDFLIKDNISLSEILK